MFYIEGLRLDDNVKVVVLEDVVIIGVLVMMVVYWLWEVGY